MKSQGSVGTRSAGRVRVVVFALRHVVGEVFGAGTTPATTTTAAATLARRVLAVLPVVAAVFDNCRNADRRSPGRAVAQACGSAPNLVVDALEMRDLGEVIGR